MEKRNLILNLTPDKAKEIGIKYRNILNKLKNRVKEEDFKLNAKELKKILNFI